MVDLGSGAGRDCFLLSKLVGSTGFVTGVDMTPEQVRDNTPLCLLESNCKRIVAVSVNRCITSLVLVD